MRVPDALTDGPRFAAFTERYVRHTKGRWAGKPLTLEEWQREFWWEALEVDPVTGLRIYQEIGLGIPRKNGKSMMASAAGIYGLMADGEAEPEVYAAASHRGQAGIVLGQALRIARQSPRLLQRLHVTAHRIDCPGNGGWMRAIASEGAGQTGLNPSWSIVDEIHAHKNPDVYNALTTAGGAREQPVTLWITTWGLHTEALLSGLYGQMFDGPGELEVVSPYLRIYRDRANGVLIYWYGAEKGADIEDPAIWVGSNPASWLSDGKYLRSEFGKMKARGAMLEWRAFHLNMPTPGAEAWLPEGAWDECRSAALLSPLLPIGVGISKTAESDMASVVIAQRQGDRVIVVNTMYHPTRGDGRVDTEAMRVHLRSLRKLYPMPAVRDPKTRMPIPGPAYAFDKWAFAESADMLEQAGLNMVDFPQYASTMGPATTQAYELITTKRLAHDGDQALRAHVDHSLVAITDRGMKLQVNKEPPDTRNPAAVAMVMAVAMAMQDAPKPRERRSRAGVGF